MTGNQSDAADLTQESYLALMVKGGQIRDPLKIKGWLFTTLYRKFLGQHRHRSRFPEVQVESVEWELPSVKPEVADNLAANDALDALQTLDAKYRAPLALFYLREFSYREIASTLGLPVGTIMSRLSRGKEILRQRLEAGIPGGLWRDRDRQLAQRSGAMAARRSSTGNNSPRTDL